ncbi:MAG: hypothetical protein HQL90_14115 [Magnetococcales bacterium]|nr:hypothetical protein [Magnetococcales bacterium]
MAIHPGITVQLGGKEWVCPPLNFYQLQQLLPRLQSMQAGELNIEWLQASVEIIHASLSRNYPDLTLQTVAEMVDMNNFTHILNTVMEVSGLVSKKGVPGQQ